MTRLTRRQPTQRPLQTLARTRIATWYAASGKSQADVAKALGRNQVWFSRFLRGVMPADLDTLQQLAAIFGHTITALLQVTTDPEEAVLLDFYRRIRPSARPVLIDVARLMAGPELPPPPSVRGRRLPK